MHVAEVGDDKPTARKEVIESVPGHDVKSAGHDSSPKSEACGRVGGTN
jgi:hypothetical protein